MNSYPAPKGCLAETVSKHLKAVNYERWAELYWRGAASGGLSARGRGEIMSHWLCILNRENFEVVRGKRIWVGFSESLQGEDKWVEVE